MGYWRDKYPQKTTLQGTDELLIQDSDNNTTTMDDIKAYIETNSTVIADLNSKKIVLITDTLNSSTTAKTIAYPTGFTSSNTMILSVMYYNQTYEWTPLPNEPTEVSVSLITGGIRMQCVSSAYYGASIKLAICKF